MATAEVPSDGRKPHEKKESGYYTSQMFDYFFDTEDIPCLNASTQSSKVDQFIASERPVLMTNTDLVKTALHWDLNYLEQHLGDGDFTVYTSDNDKFLYHDEKKMEAVTNFKPPTKRREMKFPEFVSKIKSWKKGSEKQVKISNHFPQEEILCYMYLYFLYSHTLYSGPMHSLLVTEF
ncbi:hypoxia-inducible factor 1-alpha inhibitor-like [Lingula anatina]|uniref:Hypoxia-inducible factor 1-alpha inhibitor-like n=1 Tax=Lingula anatina TaxID=7574 RepID=A0A2R2MPM5_LINAN|nr:hypoxia-inducible factor 1-alpha inhibitor-like [Lingula anatina]|eukprot:XP_023932189.1 hypoxia-inducible factor 1-alpha inhibitor-like [Lingula anatina]